MRTIRHSILSVSGLSFFISLSACTSSKPTTDDTAIPEPDPVEFDETLFPAYVFDDELAAARFADGSGCGRTLAATTSYTAVGCYSPDNMDGNIVIWQTGILEPGEPYTISDELIQANITGETEGVLGVRLNLHDNLLYASSEYASNGRGENDAGHALAFDLSSITGEAASTGDAKLLSLYGKGEDAWLDGRTTDDTYAYIGSSSLDDPALYGLKHTEVAKKTYNTGALITDAGYEIKIAWQEIDDIVAEWPLYRTLKASTGRFYLGDPRADANGLENSGALEVMDAEGNLLYYLYSESAGTYLGGTFVEVPDQNGDGVPDVVVFGYNHDVAYLLDGAATDASDALLAGPISGPVRSYESASNYHLWGFVAGAMTVGDTDLMVVGAPYGYADEGTDVVGYVAYYTVEGFLAGDGPFTTDYGTVADGEYGRGLALPDPQVNTYEQAEVLVGAPGASQVTALNLQQIIDLAADSSTD